MSDELLQRKAAAFDAIFQLLNEPGEDWSSGADYLDIIDGLISGVPGYKIRDMYDHTEACLENADDIRHDTRAFVIDIPDCICPKEDA